MTGTELSGWAFTSEGAGQAWTNPNRVSDSADGLRATLPNAKTWTTSAELRATSGGVNLNAIIGERAVVQSIELRIYVGSVGLITPPYRVLQVRPATSAAAMGVAISRDTNSLTAPGWNSFEGSPDDFGLGPDDLRAWRADAGLSVQATTGNGSGSIGVDAATLTVTYTRTPIAAAWYARNRLGARAARATQ